MLRQRHEACPTAPIRDVFAAFLVMLNGPASLNQRRWDDEIRGHCGKLLRALSLRLTQLSKERYVGTSGQNSGSSNITDTNTMTVNGKPTFK